MSNAPESLASGGRSLWDAISDAHELDATQLVQLEEACRAKDRCDFLDGRLREEMDSTVLKDANATANLLKQLLAALRLPDAQTGKRPQFRGPRGAVKPQVPGGKVSSLDRARAAKSS
ncbi:hypothetical protein LRP67_16290 [Nocardioides sp. cx-169]|uniref:hypothetical protein n=1 Tax=Nocardioides sp. cx-169 TaxID=2899080 RepID=UPI001E41CA02|nr:hypothetical protein [Nocardioides sp. cx-169]MCD4535653.1 hypothetical protein [Nocardioides sp. cx-169]